MNPRRVYVLFAATVVAAGCAVGTGGGGGDPGTGSSDPAGAFQGSSGSRGAATSGSAARRCGGGLLVNVGRGISWSSSDEEVARSSTASLEVAVRARAAEWARRLAILAT